MKNRKIPMRTCVITKEKLEKKDLIRVVKNKETGVSIDKSGKANGRGAYLKKERSVVEKVKMNKLLDRVLEIDIPDDIYEELISITQGGEAL